MRVPRSLNLCVAITILGGAASCAEAPPVALMPQVQAGPGYQTRPTRVLALSASCGSVDFQCPPEYGSTVDGIVRSGLEFAGYAVVQPDQLRLETRQRHETHESERSQSASQASTKVERTLDFDDNISSSHATQSASQRSTIILDGPGFDDLTVAERQQVLTDAGADGVLSVRIVVGALVGGWTPNQDVEVMVKLGVDDGDTMAWASRCTASSNDFSTANAALENAARCAISAATGK